ncbi:MAG: DUF5398 family protein [Waddliaceae bacterium]
MFGLENKDNSNAEFIFDLEKELSDRNKHEDLRKHIQDQVLKIKDILRKGDNKESYDKFGQLLYGYIAILKVMSRINPK